MRVVAISDIAVYDDRAEIEVHDVFTKEEALLTREQLVKALNMRLLKMPGLWFEDGRQVEQLEFGSKHYGT